MIDWFEKSLTKSGKVVTALVTILGAVIAGGTAVYHIDNWRPA